MPPRSPKAFAGLGPLGASSSTDTSGATDRHMLGLIGDELHVEDIITSKRLLMEMVKRFTIPGPPPSFGAAGILLRAA